MSAVQARERAEAEAYDKPDRRYKARKERTVLISYRIKPEVHQKIIRMADAEGVPMVEIIERGVLMLDRMMRGEKP
jgi:SRSO17 transposase